MFKRGFKTACERIALDKRAQLGVQPTDPIDPRALAAKLGIRVLTPQTYLAFLQRACERCSMTIPTAGQRLRSVSARTAISSS